MTDTRQESIEAAFEELKQKLAAMSDEHPEKLAAFLVEFEAKLDELQKIIDEPDT